MAVYFVRHFLAEEDLPECDSDETVYTLCKSMEERDRLYEQLGESVDEQPCFMGGARGSFGDDMEGLEEYKYWDGRSDPRIQ